MKTPQAKYKIGQNVLIHRTHDIQDIAVKITKIRGRAVSFSKGGEMLYAGKDSFGYTILFDETNVKGILTI